MSTDRWIIGRIARIKIGPGCSAAVVQKIRWHMLLHMYACLGDLARPPGLIGPGGQNFMLETSKKIEERVVYVSVFLCLKSGKTDCIRNGISKPLAGGAKKNVDYPPSAQNCFRATKHNDKLRHV